MNEIDAPANTTAEQDRQTAGERLIAAVKPPSTTAEDDRRTQSQRQINLVWETTQMRIALSVIWAALAVSGILSVAGKVLASGDVQLASIVFLFGVANLVTGFYFGRTNHARQGGVGGEKLMETR